MKRADGGFTLIEMMVTLIVASVLMAMAIPAFQDMIRVNRLITTANELVTALLRARAEALKLGTNVVVCGSGNPDAAAPACDGNWTGGWIVFADDGATPNQYDTTEELMLVYGGMPDNYSVTPSQSITNRVTFRPQGVVAGTWGNLKVIDADYDESMRMVCVGSTGKTRVLSMAVSLSAACP